MSRISQLRLRKKSDLGLAPRWTFDCSATLRRLVLNSYKKDRGICSATLRRPVLNSYKNGIVRTKSAFLLVTKKIGLTVTQVIERLEALKRPDAIVVMSSDQEGNSYSTLRLVEPCKFDVDYSEIDHPTEPFGDDRKNTIEAVVLFP